MKGTKIKTITMMKGVAFLIVLHHSSLHSTSMQGEHKCTIVGHENPTNNPNNTKTTKQRKWGLLT